MSWVESSIGYRQMANEKMDADHDLNIFHQRLEDLLLLNKLLPDNPAPSKKQLTLGNESLAKWKNNRAEIEKKIAPDGEWEHIRDIASKASANTLRIAALIQFFYDESSEIISPDAIQCAVNLMEWHLNQACMIFYPMSERFQFEQDVRELHAWIINRIMQNGGYPILKNDLEKYGPHRLRRTEKLIPVLNQLISQGYFGVIQMFSHSALYITLHCNGIFSLPQGYGFGAQFIIIQSQNNTQGKPYTVSIP